MDVLTVASGNRKGNIQWTEPEDIVRSGAKGSGVKFAVWKPRGARKYVTDD